MSNSVKGYPLAGYGEMIEDNGRMESYVAALHRVIRPGAVVLDIGAGTGIFAMIACQLGAGKAIAVEPNPAIRLARRMVAANGFADRVECIEGMSTELELSRRADVIISDLRGVLPLFTHHLPSIIDARERLLAPDGVLIPQRDILYAAPVEATRAYQRIERPWRNNSYGLDLSAAAHYEANRWNKATIKPEQLLASARCWLKLDYGTLTRCDGGGHLSWAVERDGILHGIAVWFDTELAEGIGFSNAPGQTPLIYGQGFMPLPAPVQVEAGGRIEADISAHWVKREYIWRWRGEVFGFEGAIKARFDQSTFAGKLTSVRTQS